MSIEAKIHQNTERNRQLFPHYNPITGEGSTIPREELSFLFKGKPVRFWLPTPMMQIDLIKKLNGGDIDTLLLESGFTPTDSNRDHMMSEISSCRLDYDFEFYAATACKIQDKESKQAIPFVLNAAQRKLLAELERLRLSNTPIRVVLLKARQWGGSTLVQIYMAWIQARLLTNWHSVVVADVEEQSRNIRGMYSRLLKYYPKELGELSFTPFEGSTKTRIIKERGCIIGVGSAQKPENLRSFDFSMAHLSEIGLWQSTPKRSAEDLAQSVANTIPFSPNTLIVKESTAKGVGNYFHREWIAAERGESAYSPVFVAWFEIERYRMPVDNPVQFIKSWTEDELWQWEQGATLEGIMWYRNYKAAENYDDWRMKSEFPTTATEAFQSTGRRRFRPMYVSRARKTCEKPLRVGELMGKSIMGKESLEDIEFVQNDKGCLKVWIEPDRESNIKNRYCLFADIGGTSEGADYSTIKVIDRYWMMFGDRPEVCAVWHGHLDQDMFAWKAAQLGMWYNKGLLAVEVNSLVGKGDDTEGDHTLTVLDEIVDYYPNLYARTTPDRVKQGAPVKWGFHTNKSTKPMIIDTLNGALRDELYIEKDNYACDEMDSFEYKPNGSLGAVEGQKDDRVISTAGCVWLATKFMDLPEEVVQAPRRKNNIISEASF